MKILLVEDDKGASRFIRKGLVEKGYTVDPVFDGEEGLYMSLSNAYDLVILDIMLPEINGFEILKTIRKKAIQTPVIILTAKDTTEDIVHGLETGANDYLVKPFAFAELLARIRAVMRGRAEKKCQTLSAGDLSLNFTERTALRNGKKIELSEKEYLLLDYLMRNQGQILTRSMILEKVWGYNFDTNSNIIEVHINRLRAKIDRDFETKLIHTIKSVGYVLKV